MSFEVEKIKELQSEVELKANKIIKQYITGKRNSLDFLTTMVATRFVAKGLESQMGEDEKVIADTLINCMSVEAKSEKAKT